ncbi:MAG: DUF4012 domain-containing protein [Candidatus Pacebacteria bacterium]|nr:DUF4012 domain-containing protein [Candidatus Paceibacterota bacterium]
MFLIVIFIFSFIYSTIQTKKTYDFLIQNDFSKAKISSQKAILFPTIISQSTLHQSDTLEAWTKSLSLISKLEQFEENVQYIGKNMLDPTIPQANLIVLEEQLVDINNEVIELNNHLNSSFILKNLSITNKINQTLKITDQIINSLKTINKDPHTFLILLQNTEELRASGGFMGSYARIDLNEGKVTNITIQDIYEPDGQFTGFVDAPPGAKEYLSGGQGLRLPDSNWHPDFPTSAKIISSYFAFGDERKIDSIITVNVDQIEKILKIVGDIYLPDYGLTVTSDNLTALARADRNAFFAGSKQKANFLTSLFNNLKIELTKLNSQQQTEIIETLLRGLQHKDLQLFSWHPQLQDIFVKYNVAGEIEYQDQSDFYLYLLETNVGINKANKKITREVKINLGQNRTDLEVKFHNDGSESLLDYINYQRIIVNPMVTVKEVRYGEEKISFYEDLITNSKGKDFKQVGFLIPLESGQSKTLNITLNYQTICVEKSCKLQIQKQSGIQPTPYQINYMGKSKNIVLEQDEIITF